MYKAQVYVSPSNEEVAQGFAAWLVNWIKAQEQKQINIALSGGSTPKVLFKILAEQYNDPKLWSKVHFYWGDERCVPIDNSDSNYKMTNDLFFKPANIPINNIHRVQVELSPEEAAQDYAQSLGKLLPQDEGWPIFDLIILGMGSDGHTASIFPHQMELLTSANFCEVAIHPDSGQKRVSLTGKLINKAKQICFLVTGDSKKEKVYEIFKEQKNYQTYPAYFIKPENGSLSWYMDEHAAALIN